MIHEQRPDRREEYRGTETAGERRGRFETEGYGEPHVREPHTRESYRETYPETAREPYREPTREPHRTTAREPYTETDTRVQTVYSTSGINILAGLWLILAPFALGYAAVEAAVWNSIVIGLAVAIMALVRVTKPTEFEGVSWVNFVLGIWLIVSPFALNLMAIDALVWNNIIVGIVVIALAATSAMATRRMHEHPGQPKRRWSA